MNAQPSGAMAPIILQMNIIGRWGIFNNLNVP